LVAVFVGWGWFFCCLGRFGWLGLVVLLSLLTSSLRPSLLPGYLKLDDCWFFRGGGGGVACLGFWKGDFWSDM
jgi:hypothetical protein